MKILLFRALKIGDMLCAMPAIVNLRQHFKKDRIGIIVLPSMVSFMERFSDYFDDIIPFSGYPGLPEQAFSKQDYQQMLKYIHSEKYDLFIQMHGNGSGLQGFLSDLSIPNIWGFSPIPEKGRFTYPSHLHEIQKHNALLQWYGVQTQTEEIPFPTSSQDEYRYGKLVDAYNLDKQPYVVIHPGASCDERRWGIHNFTEVIKILNAKGYSLVISGVENEQPLVDTLRRSVDFPFYNAIGKADLGVTALLLKDSAGLITNCTGVSHLGAATQTLSVVISKDGEPLRWGPLNKYLHKTFDCHSHDKLEEVLQYVQTTF